MGREDIFTNDSNKKNNDEDFVPMSFALAKAIHGQESNRNMLVLFNPGSMSTWISSNKHPEGTKGDKAPPLIGMTIAGQFYSNKTVELTNLCFPEFYRTQYFSSCKARVFETSCCYDMIIGCDMLRAMGLIVDLLQGQLNDLG
jgi:hypothetical protein